MTYHFNLNWISSVKMEILNKSEELSQCGAQIVLLTVPTSKQWFLFKPHCNLYSPTESPCEHARQPFFVWTPDQTYEKQAEFLHKSEWFFTMWNANSAAHGTNKQAMIVIQATLQPFFTLLSLVVSKVIVRGVIILWPTLERQAAACFCLFLLPQLSWG